MIESGHKKLSVRCQAALLGINRNRLPKDSGRAESPPCEDLAILKDLDALTACVPEIFNTDQGCQFTSAEWIAAVEGHGIRVSMDGKGRWMDNVFIERLWRSLKCENIYLRSYRNLIELEAGVAEWIHD